MSKLNEVVREHPFETLFIGSASAFFFIGDFEEYEKEIDQISERYKEVFDTSLKSAEREWKYFRYYMPKDHPQYEIKHAAYLKAKLKKQYFDEHPNLREREVVKMYPSILDPGTIIIIEGYEAGKYWLKSEYEGGATNDVDDNESV